jgi:peptidoglycan/LPS O-acetylase OafA/YrhL
MLPCTFATLICFVLAEFGGFKTGSVVMSGWMAGTSPLPSGGVWNAVCTLFRAVLDTWSWSHNELERNQWAMLYFLKGALAVYIFLLATVRTQGKWRMCVAAGLIYYGWRGLDRKISPQLRNLQRVFLTDIMTAYIFMPMFTGVLLAEASMTPLATLLSSRRLFRLLPYIPLALGWYCISFPNRFHRRMPWSAHMLDFGLAAFPLNADIHAFYSHIGASLIITGITFSASMQRFFNLRVFQWLGARSFPIYLVHGPVLRSFLNWILFWGAELVNFEERDEEGNVTAVHPMYPIPPLSTFMWAVPVFVVVVFVLADLWLKFVEPRCGRIAKWIEDAICVRQEDVGFTDKTSAAQEYTLVEGSSSGSPHSPFSRATTPLNEVELILPR